MRGISHMTAREFEGLSERTVCTISISTLSKTLHPDTTKRETFATFFRWFDIHRKNPTQLTVQWPNVLTHWVQRLASRGFTEEEIAEEVNIWTRQIHLDSCDQRRLPPTTVDISKALGTMPTDEKPRDNKIRDEIRSRRERETDSWWTSDSSRGEMRDDITNPTFRRGDRRKEEMTDLSNSSKAERTAYKRKMADVYGQPPPSNYVCNRCNKKGHHLQVCPTNLDPDYDRPPSSTYICEICNAVGEHFKSLCPRNTDPYSITQKRKSRGIRTPTKATSRILREWEADTQRKIEMEESGVDRDSRKRIKTRQYESADLERGRLTQELSSSSPSEPSEKTEMMGLKESEKEPLRFSRGQSEEVQALIRNGAILGDGSKQGHRGADLFLDYGGVPSSPPVGFRTKGEYAGDFEIDVDTGSEEEMDIEVKKPVKVYSSFVEGLVSKHPEMKDTVNPAPQRPTAREMWKKDAKRQAQEAAASSLAQSPTWDGCSSEFENIQVVNKYKPFAGGFDGAFDERVGGLDTSHNRTRSFASITTMGKASIGHVKAFTAGLRRELSPSGPHHKSPDNSPLCSSTDQEYHMDLDEKQSFASPESSRSLEVQQVQVVRAKDGSNSTDEVKRVKNTPTRSSEENAYDQTRAIKRNGKNVVMELTSKNLRNLGRVVNGSTANSQSDDFSVRGHDGSWYEADPMRPTLDFVSKPGANPSAAKKKPERLRKLTKEEQLYREAILANMAAKDREENEAKMIAVRRKFIDSENDSDTDEHSIQEDLNEKASDNVPTSPGHLTKSTHKQPAVEDIADEGLNNIQTLQGDKSMKATVEDDPEGDAASKVSAAHGDDLVTFEEAPNHMDCNKDDLDDASTSPVKSPNPPRARPIRKAPVIRATQPDRTVPNIWDAPPTRAAPPIPEHHSGIGKNASESIANTRPRPTKARPIRVAPVIQATQANRVVPDIWGAPPTRAASPVPEDLHSETEKNGPTSPEITTIANMAPPAQPNLRAKAKTAASASTLALPSPALSQNMSISRIRESEQVVKKPAVGRLRDLAKSFKVKNQDSSEQEVMVAKDQAKPGVLREMLLNDVLRGFGFQ
ncbi:uncharacterized protein PAC_11994 [Phialocephala subalpina]|uniref:Zinc knuckle CX2CX3GHX4C domain-containing protein n=1 Tax=Phialocephala subalpina TaxID=576137 RepID=A0A1L7XAU5_9HELO|nr:uncharacterized protein PAC_11994 [Phialocephala subalpina]